jgi:hypothetical protein
VESQRFSPTGRSGTTLRRSELQELLREKRGLEGSEFLEAGLGEGEEGLELVAGKRRLFTAALNFNELASAGHDDVGVDLGVFVFDIVEIEEGIALIDAGADGGDGIDEGVLGDFFGVEEFLDREAGGEVGAGD